MTCLCDAKPDEHEDTGKNLNVQKTRVSSMFNPQVFFKPETKSLGFSSFLPKKNHPTSSNHLMPPLPPQGVDQALLESQLG